MYIVVTGAGDRKCKTWETVVRLLNKQGLEPGASSNIEGVTFVWPKPSAQLELFGAGDYAPADTLF